MITLLDAQRRWSQTMGTVTIDCRLCPSKGHSVSSFYFHLTDFHGLEMPQKAYEQDYWPPPDPPRSKRQRRAGRRPWVEAAVPD